VRPPGVVSLTGDTI